MRLHDDLVPSETLAAMEAHRTIGDKDFSIHALLLVDLDVNVELAVLVKTICSE